MVARRTVSANFLRVSPDFAASCTDFVVEDLLILDLVDRPHAKGDLSSAWRRLGSSVRPARNVDQYDDRVSKGLCCTMV